MLLKGLINADWDALVRPVADASTIVLVGSFNPAILRPEWVARFGLGRPLGQDFDVEILAPVDSAIAPTRYRFLGLDFSLARNRIVFHAADPPAGDRAAAALSLMLRELRHTPVVGVGLNMAFVDQAATDAFIAQFQSLPLLTDQLPDSAVTNSQKWAKTVSLGGLLQTFTAELTGAGGRLEFNFHQSTADAEAASVYLAQDGVYSNNFALAARIAASVLGSEMEV